jgi:hypothetical protein
MDEVVALRREGSSRPSRVYRLAHFVQYVTPRVLPASAGSSWRLAVVASGWDREGHRRWTSARLVEATLPEHRESLVWLGEDQITVALTGLKGGGERHHSWEEGRAVTPLVRQVLCPSKFVYYPSQRKSIALLAALLTCRFREWTFSNDAYYMWKVC